MILTIFGRERFINLTDVLYLVNEKQKRQVCVSFARSQVRPKLHVCVFFNEFISLLIGDKQLTNLGLAILWTTRSNYLELYLDVLLMLSLI